MTSKKPRLYNIPILSRGIELLEVLQSCDRPVSLQELARRTAIPKSTLFRMVHTYVNRKYVARTPAGLYRALHSSRKFRIGLTSNCEDPFYKLVRQSIVQATANNGIELLALDGHESDERIVQKAQALIDSECDLVMVQNSDEMKAPIIGHMFSQAGIPLIALNVSHPDAVYFGLDNYRVGVEAGRLLLQHASQQWQGEADAVLVLNCDPAQPAADRTCGALHELLSALPGITVLRNPALGSRAAEAQSEDVLASLLRGGTEKKRRLLVVAPTEIEAAILSAVSRLAAKAEIAIVVCGMQCGSIHELDQCNTFVGYVSPDPVNWGASIVALGMAIIRGEPVQPYNFGEYRISGVGLYPGNTESQPAACTRIRLPKRKTKGIFSSDRAAGGADINL